MQLFLPEGTSVSCLSILSRQVTRPSTLTRAQACRTLALHWQANLRASTLEFVS